MIENENTILVIKEFNTAIKIEDGVIYGYDLNGDDVLFETEGKMTQVCVEIAEAIEDFYKIKLKDYNVAVIEDVIDIPSVNNTAYKKNDKKEKVE